MREIQAGIEEVRPGRRLFVRQWILNDKAGDKKTVSAARRTAFNVGETLDDNNNKNTVVDLQLVMVHGMCATELQYHEMLHAIEQEMTLLDGNIENNDNNNSSKPTSTRSIHCVMYDMVGCGQSPVVSDWEAYSKKEHIQDLQAIVKRGRDSLLPNKNNKKKIPTILVAHSYGPSIVLSWLASLQQEQEEDPEQEALVDDDDDWNIHGLVFLSTSLRDDALPHPDGGMWLFHYVPKYVLQCLDPLLKADFCHRAVYAKHQTLKQVMLEATNDMHMVRAFHRQAKWATRDDLQTALQVLQRSLSLCDPSMNSSTRKRIRCLVVHGADDGIIDIRQGQKLVNLLREHQEDSSSLDDGRVNHDDDDGTTVTHKLIVIPEASHMIMLEQPTMVARAILEYLHVVVTKHADSFPICDKVGS